MKNFKRIIIGMSALVLLTACGGQKVSRAKFQAKIDALEEHTYSEATVKYSINLTGTSGKKESGTVTFRNVSGLWVTDDLAHEGYGAMLYSYKGQKAPEDSIENNIKYKYTFYINPLKVVATVKGENKTDDNNFSKVNDKISVTMDKYGYTTSYVQNVDEHSKGVVLGTAFETKVKGTEKYTISYK